MKRIFMVVAALMMMAATGFAQDAVPATKVNGKGDLETLLKPLTEKLKDVADDDDQKAAKIIFDFAKENANEAGVYVITNLLAYMTKTEDLSKPRKSGCSSWRQVRERCSRTSRLSIRAR